MISVACSNPPFREITLPGNFRATVLQFRKLCDMRHRPIVNITQHLSHRIILFLLSYDFHLLLNRSLQYGDLSSIKKQRWYMSSMFKMWWLKNLTLIDTPCESINIFLHHSFLWCIKMSILLLSCKLKFRST